MYKCVQVSEFPAFASCYYFVKYGKGMDEAIIQQ